MKKLVTRIVELAHYADRCGYYKIAEDLDKLSTSMIDETKTGPATKLSDLADWEAGGGYNNIMSLLKSATPAEVDYWRNWYGNARKDVEALAAKYGEPFELVAAVVAVLSPGNKWVSNLRAAETILLEVHGEPDAAVAPRKGKGGGTSDIYRDFIAEEFPSNVPYRDVSAYPDNARKARDILVTGNIGQSLSGPKVTVFYDSLVHPEWARDRMVLDGHAINIWRGVKVPLKGLTAPSKEERAAMLADYRRAAADSGLSVQEVQAITWFLWKTIEE